MFEKPVAGGSYFKPKDHIADLAILLEPKRILKDQPNEYEGVQSLRDVAIADISCFRTAEDIEKQTPSLVIKDGQITNQVLVSDIEKNDWIDKQALVVVTKAKRAFVYREVTHEGAEAAVAAYFEARNADIAANLAEAPDDFGDD